MRFAFVFSLLLLPTLAQAQDSLPVELWRCDRADLFHCERVVPEKPAWWLSGLVGAMASADTLTTYQNEHRCGAGEMNPAYWTNGDWRRPDYRQMWAVNALQAGAYVSSELLFARLLDAHPRSKVLRVSRAITRGLGIYAAGRRLGAAVRNAGVCP